MSRVNTPFPIDGFVNWSGHQADDDGNPECCSLHIEEAEKKANAEYLAEFGLTDTTYENALEKRYVNK